jgi:hypothetical protein
LQLRSAAGGNTIFLGGENGDVLVGSAIKLDGKIGSIGIGTNSPIRKIHVEGSEVHSGGANSGFSPESENATLMDSADSASIAYRQSLGLLKTALIPPLELTEPPV